MCRFGAYERVRAFNDDARMAGHEITQDWTRTSEFGADGHPLKPGDESDPALWKHAVADLEGVATADACVFLADEGNYCGALIEYGYALACGVPVYVIAPWRMSIFWHSPLTTILPDETAVRDMLGMTVREAV
jgi:nucleoside 2-deoxyribosyltransferase